MDADYLLTCLVIIASPGTGALYTVATGLSRGAAPSVIAAFGCTLGIVPHMAAAGLGLAAVLQTSPAAFHALQVLGVAYLLYMAWAILRQGGGLTVEPGEAPPLPAPRLILSAVLLNLLNPKLSIFFLAFLPQFISPADPAPLQRLAVLGGVFMALTFVVFAAYGAAAAWMRRHVLGRPRVMRWLNRTFAAAFVALGLRLAFAGA